MQPTRTLVLLVSGLFALGLAQAFLPDLLAAWQTALTLLAVAAGADALLAWYGQGTLRGERQVAAILPVGVSREVNLLIEHRGRQACHLQVVDHFPAGFATDPTPLTATIPALRGTTLTYMTQPLVRGCHRFGRIEVRLQSRLGLWWRTVWLGLEQDVRVYPDFAKVTGYSLFATAHRLNQLGVLQRRRRGEGMEFHQLREYREGDNPRQIDWKATARSGHLISREYQDERDQHIVFMLDCGRRMGAHDGELSHFDHALNAVLLLANVALKQGDAVGLMTFGTATPRFLAPKKSSATASRLMDALFDLQPGQHSPDYLRAALQLSRLLPRRSLVILVSSLRDEDDDSLAPALRLLCNRHLVVFASLREAALDMPDTAPATLDQALVYTATLDYLARRQLVFKRIAASGVRCLDLAPRALPLALVNRYLDLKRSKVL